MPIDYIKIKLCHESISIRDLNEINTIRAFNLNFDPIVNNGIVVRHFTKVKNLYLTLRGDELMIKNSLIKYALGNNYENLKYSELINSIKELEKILGLSLRSAKVLNFEFGPNIIDDNISATLERMGHYKGREKLPMYSNGIPYGVFWGLTTHKMKLYSKSAEVKRREDINLDKSLLRIEKCYYRSHLDSLSCLRHNRINTLGDLINWQTLQILTEDLIASLNKIEIAPLPEEIERMSPMNLRRWSYLQNPYLRGIMKRRHRKVFERDRKIINEIDQDYLEDGHFKMIQKVREQLEYCLMN